MTFNTLDTAELDHFKGLSSTWWNEDGPFRILHAITSLRVAFIKEKAGVHFDKPNFLKGLRILDVGCGGGLLCEPLARLGADVTGIDPIEENIQIASHHAQAMGLSISYLPCAIEDMKPESKFDLVIASEIIEHVSDPDGFITACASHLVPSGGMVVTTFNKTLKSYLLGVLLAEYVLKWAPKGTHHWEKFIPLRDLTRKLLNLGFGHQDISGLEYSPLTREWTLSPNTDINYFLWAARTEV